jgi:hypothetical protein
MHGGGGFHGGGFGGGGFHGGGFHGSAGGFHAGGVHGPGPGFRNGGINRTAGFRGQHLGWHRYGYWQNGVWIGIWPGYYGDSYDAAWNYYCNPESPYFDPDYCGD